MDIFLRLHFIFLVILIISIPLFMQRTSYQSINEKKFKLYRIKRFGFLFRGMQGASASSHGVILPMLYIQIQGYVVGILSLILFVISEIYNFFKECFLILIVTMFIHMFSIIIITVISGFISKKRSVKKWIFRAYTFLRKLYF